MASHNDSSLTFFAKATSEQWAFVLNQYKEVFKIHAQETRGSRKNGPAELIKLDNWYQDQLPSNIRSRKDHQLVYEELVQLTKWKLLRGKFRPSLLDLVKTNTETAVKNVTKKAFKKMPNIASAINALTTLKGIGPATASAILVAYSPDVCPYMADENMLATPGVEATDYTSTEYLNYVQQLNNAVERLKKLDPKGEWTPHKVELALWTHYQMKHYNSPLIEKMPVPKSNQIAPIDEDSVGQDENDEEEEDEEQLNGEESGDVSAITGNGVSNGHKVHSDESDGADSNGADSIQSNSADLEENSLSNGIDSNGAESNGHQRNGSGSSSEQEVTNDSLSNDSQSNGLDMSLPQSNGTIEIPILAPVVEQQVQLESTAEPISEPIAVEPFVADQVTEKVTEPNIESSNDNAISIEPIVPTSGVMLNGESILSAQPMAEEKSCDSLKEQCSGNSVTNGNNNGIETQKRKEIDSFEDESTKRIKVQE